MKKIKINYDLNGGKIPVILTEPNIRKKIFPIVYSDSNIYNNNNIIVNNKSESALAYNLNNQFIFNEYEERLASQPKIDILDFYDEEIEFNQTNKIPFHACFINNKFSIVTKFHKLLQSNYVNNELISKEDQEFAISQIKKYFILHRDTLQFIGLSARSNIINKIIFANKLRELLEIIYNYSDLNEIPSFDSIKDKYLSLFGNNISKCTAFNNLSDLMNLFNEYTLISNYKIINHNKISLTKEELDEKINSLLVSKEQFIDKDINDVNYNLEQDYFEIRDLIKFNIILNKYDTLVTPLNIKLSQLFYATIIGYRLLNTSLNIGYLSSKLYPINLINFISNLINKPINLSKSINKEHCNYLIYKNNILLPTYHNYGQSKFISDEGIEYNFPDCVENTLLQFIKTLTWNSETKSFNVNYLPKNSMKQLKDFISNLNVQNDNTQEIKNNFVSIVSNIRTFENIYKNINKYEIKSSIENFIKIASYLFGLKYDDQETFVKYINKKYKNKSANVKNITIENNTILVESIDDTKIIFTINVGHSTHHVSSNIICFLDTFIYTRLVLSLTSNYSLLTSLNLNIFQILEKINKNNEFTGPNINEKEVLLDNKLYFLDLYDSEGNIFSSDLSSIINRKPIIVNKIKQLNTKDQIKLFYESSFIINNIFDVIGFVNNSVKFSSIEYELFRHYLQLLSPNDISNLTFEIPLKSENYASINLIYFITFYFYKFCSRNKINMNSDLVYCNFVNKIIDPVFNIIIGDSNFNTIFKKIFHTKSIGNVNSLYDLIYILPVQYQKYFCKYLNNNYIKNVKINKFIEISN